MSVLRVGDSRRSPRSRASPCRARSWRRAGPNGGRRHRSPRPRCRRRRRTQETGQAGSGAGEGQDDAGRHRGARAPCGDSRRGTRAAPQRRARPRGDHRSGPRARPCAVGGRRLRASTAGVSIAGYGEMLYENYASSKTDQFDFLRAILYAGYRFNDRFLFNSEIEVEHAKEIFVELRVRRFPRHRQHRVAGRHAADPDGAGQRVPRTDRLHGSRAARDREEHHPDHMAGERRRHLRGVREGRVPLLLRSTASTGPPSRRAASAAAARRAARRRRTTWRSPAALDVTPTPGMFFGASFYTGGSGQGDIVVDGTGTTASARASSDVHAQVQMRGFDVRALFAQALLDDTVQLNQVLGLTGSSGVRQEDAGRLPAGRLRPPVAGGLDRGRGVHAVPPLREGRHASGASRPASRGALRRTTRTRPSDSS